METSIAEFGCRLYQDQNWKLNIKFEDYLTTNNYEFENLFLFTKFLSAYLVLQEF